MKELDKEEISELCVNISRKYFTSTKLLVDGIPITIELGTVKMKMVFYIYIAGMIRGVWVLHCDEESLFIDIIKKVYNKRFYRMSKAIYSINEVCYGKDFADKERKKYNAKYYLVASFGSSGRLAATLRKAEKVILVDSIEDKDFWDKTTVDFIEKHPEMFEDKRGRDGLRN